MNTNLPILSLPAGSQVAISQATRALQESGLLVLPSFDLKAARQTHQGCACPHHGTEFCDCQMVVLLVYNAQNALATVVAHSMDGETQFELVDSPQQPADPQLREQISTTLALLVKLFMDPNWPGWMVA